MIRMTSQAFSRIVTANIFFLMPRGCQNISKSLKQVFYVLTWAQLWEGRRKKWLKWLWKLQSDNLGFLRGGLLLGSTFFRFDKDGIKNEELQNIFEDTAYIDETPKEETTNKNNNSNNNNNNNKWWKSPLVSSDTKNKLCQNGWECLVSKADFVIFRKSNPNSTTYIYKVFGRYLDISAADFFFTQVDNTYRKSWDKYVSEIRCLAENSESKQELLYWVVKYPYPMMQRDYLLLRRTIIDREKNRMAIISRTTSDTNWPPVSNSVRVDEYSSSMLLYAHNEIERKGFDYQLTSIDNPRTNIPEMLNRYAITSGLPDYINRVYLATKDMFGVGLECLDY